MQDWNGTSFFPVTSTHQWFQITWPEDWQPIHFTAEELPPMVVAAAIWGSRWSQQRSCCRCDNMAVIELLKFRTSQDQLLMHFLLCLSFYAAYFRFQFCATQVPGIQNAAADALSRNNMLRLNSAVPQGQQFLIPSAILDLLVHSRPDSWTSLFRRSLTGVSPQQQEQSTIQSGGST